MRYGFVSKRPWKNFLLVIICFIGVCGIMMYRKHERLQFRSNKPSRTVQDPRDECDVNKLMAKYRRTGMISHLAKHPPRYEDVSQVVSFQEALNIVQRAEEEFMKMSASIRAKFGNDPGAFMAFVQNPDNAEEMYSLGIAKRPEEAPPVKVDIANPDALIPLGVDQPPASKPGKSAPRGAGERA